VLFLPVLCAGPLRGQVSIGVKGGIPLTHFILDRAAGSRVGSSRVTSAPRRYTLGPFVSFPVRDSLSVETGVLYKRFGFDTVSFGGSFIGPFTGIVSSTTGNSWEFPIAARLRLRFARGLNGFLSAGPTLRRLSGIHEEGTRTVRTAFPPPERIDVPDFETDSPQGMDRRTSVGLSVSGGFELYAGPLLIEPGARVTRWDTERTSSMSAASRLGRTQAEILLGIGFAGDGRRALAARLPGGFELGILAGASLLTRSELQFPVSFSSFARPARPFTGGGFLEWRRHPRLSLEGSFLTSRFGHEETTSFSRQSLSGYAWEFPLLVKWRAMRTGRGAALTIGGGPAWRRAGSVEWISTFNGMSFRIDASPMSRSTRGFAITSGFETRTGAVRFRPEVRYCRFSRPIYDFGSVRSRRESISIILGLGWASSRQP
jgi:hypothetical protein